MHDCLNAAATEMAHGCSVGQGIASVRMCFYLHLHVLLVANRYYTVVLPMKLFQ
jgi:hypothetical protein